MYKRTFVAVKFSPEKEFFDAVSRLKNEFKHDKIKWVDTGKIHLTLFFVGNTSTHQIDLIKEQLKISTEKFQNFEFIVKGFGYFGSRKNPRVLWFGIDEYENLQLIQHLITTNFKKIGLKQDKPDFKPHITIGRVNSFNSYNKIDNLKEYFSKTIVQKVEVNEIIFYESILSPQEANYKPIEIFKLNQTL